MSKVSRVVTVELPDRLVWQARLEASRRGMTLDQLVIEALEQRMSAKRLEPAWRRYFGALRDLHSETRRIDAIVADEFESIDQLDDRPRFCDEVDSHR